MTTKEQWLKIKGTKKHARIKKRKMELYRQRNGEFRNCKTCGKKFKPNVKCRFYCCQKCQHVAHAKTMLKSRAKWLKNNSDKRKESVKKYINKVQTTPNLRLRKNLQHKAWYLRDKTKKIYKKHNVVVNDGGFFDVTFNIHSKRSRVEYEYLQCKKLIMYIVIQLIMDCQCDSEARTENIVAKNSAQSYFKSGYKNKDLVFMLNILRDGVDNIFVNSFYEKVLSNKINGTKLTTSMLIGI